MLNQLYQFIGGFYQIFERHQAQIINALTVTLKSVGIATLIALVVGTVLARLIYALSMRNNFIFRFLFSIINSVVNILGSYPAVVFIIAIQPVVRLLTGVYAGIYASITTVCIVAVFFYAAKFQCVLADEDQSASRAISDTALFVLSASAVTDLMGGGGLCDFLFRYGYARGDMDVIILVCIIYLPLIIVMRPLCAIIYLFFFRKSVEKPKLQKATVRKYGLWMQG